MTAESPLMDHLIDRAVLSLRRINDKLAVVAGLALLLTAGYILADIILRRFDASFGGTDEISGYVMAGVTSWAMAYALTKQSISAHRSCAGETSPARPRTDGLLGALDARSHRPLCRLSRMASAGPIHTAWLHRQHTTGNAALDSAGHLVVRLGLVCFLGFCSGAGTAVEHLTRQGERS